MLAVVVLHAGLLVGRAHQRGEDDLELTIPYNVAFWHAVEAGESPWWLPWIDAGTSTFARFPYLGPFYPAAPLFRALPPVRAVELALFAHVLLAAFGMRAWLRAQGVGERGAWLGAVVYAGSSVWRVADGEGYGTEAPVWTWLPWALAAIESAREGSAARAGALGGLAAGLVALGGHATDLYVGIVLTAAYGLARTLALGGEPRARKRLLAAASIAGVLGAGIGLAFWWPALATLDPDILSATRAPKPPIAHPLLRLVLPFRGWGTKESLYVGIVPLALVLTSLRRVPRRTLLPVLVPALTALALSFGPTALPWRALAWLPGLSRIDQGNVFAWPFALFAAALVGCALDARAARLGPRARRVLVAAIVLEMILYSTPRWTDRAHLRLLTLPSATTSAPAAQARFASLASEGASSPPRRTLPLVVRAPESAVLDWRNDSLVHRAFEDVRASAHLGSPRLRRLLRSLGPWPVDWDTYSDDRARASSSIDLGATSVATRVLDLLSVDTVFTDVRVEGDAFARSSQPRELAPGIAPFDVWVRRDPLPRYRLVARTLVLADDEDARARLLAPDFDPRSEAVLASAATAAPSAVPEALATGPTSGRVVVERYRPGDIALAVDARAGETLVIGETFLPGWRASIEGKAVPLVRANDLHMALSPPVGRHRVELRYQPPRLASGARVAVVALVTAVGLLLAPRAPRGPRSMAHARQRGEGRDRIVTER
ncbi:MAG: hypothetical protein U0610_04940 [bacterium]